MTLRVNVEDLVRSAVAVTDHGEDMATKHVAADSRIDAASSGWQGLSAAALLTRSEKWATTTTALLTRLGDHAQGLHTSAQAFADMEARNAESLTALS